MAASGPISATDTLALPNTLTNIDINALHLPPGPLSLIVQSDRPVASARSLYYGSSASISPGIVMTALLDGTIVALDDQTLEELWRVNVGTGFNAPPMTYSVNGKQYVAIASGLYRNARNKLSRAPEMKNLSNATMIFVFGL